MDLSKNFCNEESKCFSKWKKGCKVSCVKQIAWSIVAKEGTYTLIFITLHYGVKRSFESGAK